MSRFGEVDRRFDLEFDHCRVIVLLFQVFLQFLLDYPLGKKLERYLHFLVQQLRCVGCNHSDLKLTQDRQLGLCAYVIEIITQLSHSVDRAGWQVKIAFIEFFILFYTFT